MKNQIPKNNIFVLKKKKKSKFKVDALKLYFSCYWSLHLSRPRSNLRANAWYDLSF